MCLDIAFYSALELIDDYFPGLQHDGDMIFDLDMGMHVLAMGYKRYPVVLKQDGRYHRKFFEWSIITEYMDSPEKIRAMRPKMANIRSEKIADKKSFWNKIRSNRCLIPVTGIYEHREIKGWKNKVPYYIGLKNRRMYCLPGLYHYNSRIPSDPETGEVRGMYAIITRDANPLMRQIHNGGDNANRMPLFLPKDLELKWLEPNLTDLEIADILSFEMPAAELRYHTVYSIRGRGPRPDGKAKTEPFEFQNLPPLGNDDGVLQKELF